MILLILLFVFYLYHTQHHKIISKDCPFSENLSESIFVGVSSFTEKSISIYYIYHDTIAFTHALKKVFFYYLLNEVG